MLQNQKNILILQKINLKKYCCWCNKEFTKNIKINFFLYDYLYVFVQYGMLIDAKAKYCIECVDITNNVLNYGRGGNWIQKKIYDKGIAKMISKTFTTNKFRNILSKYKYMQLHKLKKYELQNWGNIDNNELHMLTSLTKKQYRKIYNFITDQIQKDMNKRNYTCNDKIKLKLKNGEYIKVYLNDDFVHKTLLIYLSLLCHGIKYKFVAYLWDIKNYRTIKRYYLAGTILCRRFFTQIIMSPSFWTKEKLLKNVPSDIPYLWGHKIMKKINIILDGKDIKISRCKEFDLSSWSFSGKSKQWSIRVMGYCLFNGLMVATIPSETSFVSGRHNDASLFDFFVCTNHDKINDILKPSMFNILFC